MFLRRMMLVVWFVFVLLVFAENVFVAVDVLLADVTGAIVVVLVVLLVVFCCFFGRWTDGMRFGVEFCV